MSATGLKCTLPGPKSIVSFVTPAKLQRISYKTCKRQLAQILQANGHFDDGILLETMEKGVWYPIIHLSSRSSYDVISDKNLLNPQALGSDCLLQQGIYEEIRCIEPDSLVELVEAFHQSLTTSSAVNNLNLGEDLLPTYIILGYNGLSNCLQDVLEDTWQEWTGARYLHLNVPCQFGLRRIVLHKQVARSNIAMFSYILLVELSTITGKQKIPLIDFIQRFRSERVQGFISVYQEASLGSNSSDSTLDFRTFTSCSYRSYDNLH